MKQIEEIEQVAEVAGTANNKTYTLVDKFRNKTPESQSKLIEKLLSLSEYWTLIVKILTYAKHFTGKKTDQRIDEIIELGNSIFEEQ